MKNGNMKIPNLPGMRFADPDRSNFSKPQNFVTSGDTMIEKYNPQTLNKQEQRLIQTLKATLGPDVETLLATLSVNRVNSKENFEGDIPDEQALAPNVLLFKGHFTEEVAQSTIEKTMVRRLVIKYFLDDHTIEIIEPIIRNSGIPQGKFLKRQRVPRTMEYGEFVSFLDFRIGEVVEIFQKQIVITECSEFTRAFYEAAGNPQGEKIEPPVDDFSEWQRRKNLKNTDPRLNEYKEYTEVRLGGGNFNKGLDKYLKNDGKVLMFDVVWDDDSFAGDRNFYKMLYYLSDDKIEIKELHEPNNGKTAFPLFLHRSYLPREPLMNHVPGMLTREEQYYRPADLRVGEKLKVFGRNFLIIDCNQFTKDYYQKEFGVEQTRVEGYSRKTGKNKTVKVNPPPHNGFGSEEDTLCNCYHLIPKPPKIDMAKIFKFDKVIFRFVCRFEGEELDLAVKKAVVFFYCADDSIMVSLVAAKNSGIQGGKFAERRRYKSEETGEYYRPGDFHIGKLFHVNKAPLRIVRTDEFTLNYMESRTDLFSGHTRTEIAGRLRDNMAKFPSAIDLRTKMESCSGYTGKMTADCLLKVCKEVGVANNYEEVFYLLNMGKMADGYKVDTKAFVDMICAGYFK